MTPAAVLAVAVGSAAGGVARYAVALGLASRSSAFPVATLLVNVAGAFLLGVVVRTVGDTVAPELRLLLTVGFCGGFTTFSTFSLELVRLLQYGAMSRAAAYLVASVVLTAGALWLGLLAGRALETARP